MVIPSVARQTASWFDPAVRSRGDRYVLEGRVTIAGGSDELVKARVRGTRQYEVVLEHERDQLFVACSCRHFEMGNLCKHVWATLRAADDAGRLSAAGRGDVDLVMGTRDEADEDEADEGKADEGKADETGEAVDAGWTVESDGKRHRLGRAPSLRIRGGADGFDLEGTFDFDGIVAPARDVVAALRRGERTVTLGDGTVGVLPEVWLNRYGVLAHLGESPPVALRFARSQVALVDALLEGQPEIAVDKGFARLRDELLRSDGLAPARVPRGFRGELRPYQRDGLAWLELLQRLGLGGCLADETGLGKTVQVLALLVARKAPRRRGSAARPRPSLVVAPRSAVADWRDEAARFAPTLRVLDHTGTDRPPPGDHFDEHDLILTTYGTLRREADLLAARRFDYVILDEAQAIKDASSAVAGAARLLQAEHRLALSGVPIEDHLDELWWIFEFLNPTMLGQASTLRLDAEPARLLEEPARAVLAKAIRPFLLRRTRAQVAADLPEQQESTPTP